MTIGQISARDDFAKRIREEKPVYLSECLYPLMQGWDSVEIRADVELGGTEQLFNLLVARDLQQEEGQSPQVAMTMPILVGTDGTRRMGKSLGNYIGVGEDANTQFGKVMSLPDEPMRQYFTLLTDLPLAEVDRLLDPGVNPRDAKEVLGKADGGPVSRDGSGRHRGAGVPEAERGAGSRGNPRSGRSGGTCWMPKTRSACPGSSSPWDLRRARPTLAARLKAEGSISAPNGGSLIDPKALIPVDDGLIVRVGKRKIARIRIG